ncbi:MAG: type IV conjugative transfer system lipoprotein TraV, partial [Rhodoferax sp.]|nr:type IV conjugative transfer system lipoprotein TraV [Rhodoferax sp.]
MSRAAMRSTNRRATLVLVTALTAVLGGCASSLTGVGGTERFACQAPVGAQCTSISGVYANADRTGHLLPTRELSAVPSLPQGRTGSAPDTPAASPTDEPPASSSTSPPVMSPIASPVTQPVTSPMTPPVPLPSAPPASMSTHSSATRSPAGTTAPHAPATLRASPRVVRLWIAPWEDADGDLHEASFVHVVIDTGRWLIERVRPAPRSRLDIA